MNNSHNSNIGMYVDIDHDYDEEMERALSLPVPKSDVPQYILESSLDSQKLWYLTAGSRPAQPQEERSYYENLWKSNFEKSAVDYSQYDVSPSQISKLGKIEFDEEILQRGKGPFSNVVSKSFFNSKITNMTLQLPRFKVIKTSKGDILAQFLVIVSYGGVTLGIWKRYSEFKDLFKKIQQLHNSGNESYKSTILSWQCIESRQKWFRCLDPDYLALKCYLLERFLQDLLFESESPDVINVFLGLSDQ